MLDQNFYSLCSQCETTASIPNTWGKRGIIIAKNPGFSVPFPVQTEAKARRPLWSKWWTRTVKIRHSEDREFLNCLLTEKQTKMPRPKPLVQSATVGPSSWFRQPLVHGAMGGSNAIPTNYLHQCEKQIIQPPKSHACVFPHIEQILGILCYALSCPKWSLAEILEPYRYLWKRAYHLWFNPVTFQWGPIRFESDEKYKDDDTG